MATSFDATDGQDHPFNWDACDYTVPMRAGVGSDTYVPLHAVVLHSDIPAPPVRAIRRHRWTYTDVTYLAVAVV